MPRTRNPPPTPKPPRQRRKAAKAELEVVPELAVLKADIVPKPAATQCGTKKATSDAEEFNSTVADTKETSEAESAQVIPSKRTYEDDNGKQGLVTISKKAKKSSKATKVAGDAGTPIRPARRSARPQAKTPVVEKKRKRRTKTEIEADKAKAEAEKQRKEELTMKITVL